MSLLSAFKSFFTRDAAAANAAATRLHATVAAAQTAVVPAANNGPATYLASKLTDADKAYLLRMVTPYAVATGGRQIFFDVLTDDAGKPLGNTAAAAIIAYADRLPNVYQSDPRAYTGPLVAVVGAAIARNLR